MFENQERTVPQAEQAEQSALGAALLTAEALGILVAQLSPEDFYRPANQAIASAMIRMWDRGERKADAVLVADELRGSKDLEMAGGPSYLISLQADTPATTNMDKYVKIIQEKSTLRRVLAAGLEIAELVYETNDVAAALTEAKGIVGNLDMPMGSLPPSPNIFDFLEMETKTDWLVPGLIERGDRLMLTGVEGGGKSVLLRQLGVQCASGIHPWDGRFIDPIRVTVIDVENSTPQIQRQLRPMSISAGQNLIADNFRIEVRTEGLNLLNRHDVRWLFERVATNRPDLLIMGPLYKLIDADPKEEQPAGQVARVFDEIRSRYGCALFLEAHTAKGNGRRPLQPFGASLWMRWPEFGYGIRPTKADPTRFKFEEWRGPREGRTWPEAIRRGGAWPWCAEPRQERAF